MKIKFKNSDGTIVAIGEMPNLAAGVGETVEDYNGVIPIGRIYFYKRNSEGVIVEKTQDEKDAISDIEKKFTKARVKTFVNGGATLEEKFERLLKVVSVLAINVKEKDVD